MITWIELNPESLRENFRILSQVVSAEKLALVLKSNAYGHGLRQIFEILKSESFSWLAVNYVEEGVELRGLGFHGRILVVGPFLPEQMSDASKFHLELFLGHDEGLSAWLSSALKPDIHIEFDTGMGRQGFRPEHASKIAETLLTHKEHVRGICMHFSNVEDVTEHAYANVQIHKFLRARADFLDRNFQLISHAASSASALILDESRFDLNRVGISLYGFWPSQATKISYKQLHNHLVELKPVLSWRTKVTSINHVDQGQYIGYGCTYRAIHNMRVAVLPVGYFEGYPRIASGSQAYVLIKGFRCPIVGRICMNMMMVDVTHLPREIEVGDIVTLIGQDGSEFIAASDVATWAQTIHYELLSRLHPNIERRIL
jgi:alanine racemase